MQYETIILELLSRIKKLEDDVAMLKQTQDNSQVAQNKKSEGYIQYKKMTDEMIDICYEFGKKISKGENPQELADDITEETGMNRNSAIMYLYAVSGMLEGTIYKRAISAKAIQKYFDKIWKEYGRAGLKKAIKATRLHANYRKECGLTADAVEEACDKAEKRL